MAFTWRPVPLTEDERKLWQPKIVLGYHVQAYAMGKDRRIRVTNPPKSRTGSRNSGNPQ